MPDEETPQPEQPPTLSKSSSDSTDRTDPPSCLERLLSELKPCQPLFATADTAGRECDIAESFAPSSWLAIAWKFAATSLTIGTLLATWTVSENPGFYMAYLTHWALLLASLYQPCSLWNTVAALRTTPPTTATTLFIRLTWTLFIMAAHAEAMASILWWVLEYEPGETEITFYTLTPHLIIVLVVWWDGLVVNRIPVRWTHWYGFVLPLECGFIVWSVIQSYANVGNPNKDDSSGADPDNDDAIYGSLAWKDSWQKSLVIAIIAIFVLGPILFLLLWLSSIYTIPCACYKDKGKYIMDNTNDALDEEAAKDRVKEVDGGQ